MYGLPDDPLYHQAVNFCHGYLVGAYHYYEAAGSGPAGLKLVCLPDPQPSRNDSFAMFVEWTKAHPQYLKESRRPQSELVLSFTLLIPQPALVESQIGKQVFVVNADNKVESRSVEVGRGYQGQWVIKKGLKKGEKVIVEGTQKVRPGMVVNSKTYSSKKLKAKTDDG